MSISLLKFLTWRLKLETFIVHSHKTPRQITQRPHLKLPTFDFYNLPVPTTNNILL